mmetsp:Transcript_1869/g.6480  ORF Transcript_1869/g.6480 Transcript_1869/m.6480 type:complete len:633 (-) Transcript_1869:270-2168(-)
MSERIDSSAFSTSSRRSISLSRCSLKLWNWSSAFLLTWPSFCSSLLHCSISPISCLDESARRDSSNDSLGSEPRRRMQSANSCALLCSTPRRASILSSSFASSCCAVRSAASLPLACSSSSLRRRSSTRFSPSPLCADSSSAAVAARRCCAAAGSTAPPVDARRSSSVCSSRVRCSSCCRCCRLSRRSPSSRPRCCSAFAASRSALTRRCESRFTSACRPSRCFSSPDDSSASKALASSPSIASSRRRSASAADRSAASAFSFCASTARRAVDGAAAGSSSDSCSASAAALRCSASASRMSDSTRVTSASSVSPSPTTAASSASDAASASRSLSRSSCARSRERRRSVYPPESAPFRLTESPSRVTQSRSCDFEKRLPTSRSRTIRCLRKICRNAGLNRSSNLSFLTIGMTSSESGYCGPSCGRSRLSGMKVTRPALACCNSLSMRAAVSSVSTTTWKSWLAAAVSTAVKNFSSTSKSSISMPYTPPIFFSAAIRSTARTASQSERDMDCCSVRCALSSSATLPRVDSPSCCSLRQRPFRRSVSAECSARCAATLFRAASSRFRCSASRARAACASSSLLPASDLSVRSCASSAAACFSFFSSDARSLAASFCSALSRAALLENCDAVVSRL